MSVLSLIDIVLPLSTQLPLPCSLQVAAMHYFDFQAIPSRYFFKLLSYFATSSLEKERLEEFASTEGQVSDDLCVAMKHGCLQAPFYLCYCKSP